MKTQPFRCPDCSPLSRRTVVTRLGVGGFAMVLATRGLGVGAQDTTSENGTSIPQVILAWAEAWNTADLERLLDLYTEDAIYEDVPFGEIIKGKDAIRATQENLLAEFTDIEVALTSGFRVDNWAVAEGTFAQTYTGHLEGLPVGAGQQISVRFALVQELDGDRIRRESNYYDAFVVLTQLGTLPGMGMEGEGTPAD